LGEIFKLNDADKSRFYAELKRKQPFQATALLSNMSDEDVATFAVNRYLSPGVDIVADSSRCYPNKNLAAHAVDDVGRINERELSELHPKKL
jgi:penicillin-binding protein 2